MKIEGGHEIAFATTDDQFLGNKLIIRQPAKGYRAGVDAVVLAAAIAPPTGSETFRLLDAGAGVGTAGLCVACRLPQAQVTLYEAEAVLVTLARHNIDRNGLQDRARAVLGDVSISAGELAVKRLQAGTFDHVIANPPYHDTNGGTLSANPLKAGSHAMDEADLVTWARFMARMARPGGRATVIHKAAALPQLLAALDGRFGDLDVRPIHPRDGDPAIRVLVTGVKGSRAPLNIAPALILHEAGQDFRPEIARVLREGAALPSGNA
jgi:tRNA1(Val) A37 N6-methylase TrmN6